MRERWWDDYVGIPYREKGRARDGADCWGLVRLVYGAELGIELPSLAEQYDADDRARQADLIAAGKEGWEAAPVPRSGDVATFRIDGHESHVGLITRPGWFLHVREGQEAVIERLDAIAWKHRLRGIYRYREGGSPITLSACPHPLQMRRIDGEMPPGMSLAQLVDHLRQAHGVPVELAQDAVIAVDGEYIPRERWATTVPTPGARVEYRAVPRGSGIGRVLGMIAIMVVAWYAAPLLAGAMGFTAGTTAFTIASGVISMGISMVGGLLLNAIFPVRPPETPSLTRPTGMPLLQGGANQANLYGTIPVVLGRFRYTPPLGATAYVESSSSNSYLRMLLVWGYGPLQVSDLRIGDTPLDSFAEVEYETLTGWDDTTEDRTHFNSLYGTDTAQEAVGITLQKTEEWVQRTLASESDRIVVSLHWPQGLFGVSKESGNTLTLNCSIYVQLRQVGQTTWNEVAQLIPERRVNLPSAWYNTDSDAELEPVYRWTRISLDKTNRLVVRHGAFTTNPAANPSGSLLARLQADNFGVGAIFDRLPALGPAEEELWQVCVLGNAVHQTVDMRGAQGLGSVTGCALTMTGLEAYLAPGEITRSQTETLYLQKATKKAFSQNVSFYVPRGTYEVRVRRANNHAGSPHTLLDDVILQAITGYANNRPVVEPKNVKLAMTAIRVRATNQLNGNIEGITGTVTTICKDYDRTTGTWLVRPTRNPASLFRHVLQHPGNAKPLPDSRIELAALADWHDFCRLNKFVFDQVRGQQQSVDDTLRDIAAAGRASPTWVDGKRTVIIDRPRSQYAQFFTPHNSWGFESTRVLPRLPHAFRVQFNNAARGYQPDERIVYNDGYSAANATLFEGLTLPGVSDSDVIFKHARFHLAQLKLRPETYTLYADWEHLVCTRGDLVAVTHDVPMWGLGSGRIKNFIDGTHLELDEAVPMDAGTSYTIRIRLEGGSSVTRTVAAAIADGYYTEITLTAAVTADEGKAGNLFMFGSLNAETVDLVVLGIEPADNLSARLTLVDYSPAVYDSDSEPIPAFESQISKPPTLIQRTITVAPTVGTIVSDESVMTRLAPGKYAYAIRISFRNPTTLPERVMHVEGQMDFAEDNTDDWQSAELVTIQAGAVTFGDVQEGSQYRLRLRYVDAEGRTGPWTATQLHTVVGKSNPPAAVTGLSARVSGSRLLIDWSDSPEPDVEQYEVRTTDANWGTADADRVFSGRASSCYFTPPAPGTYTFYARARDGAGLWSATASCTYTYAVPAVESLLISGNTLTWSSPSADFAIDGYRLRYNVGFDRDFGAAVPLHAGLVKASPFTMLNKPAGVVTIMVAAVDALGNESPAQAYLVTDLGDALVANVIETFDFDAGGYAGTKTGCSVVGGDLVADVTSLFYKADASQFYGQAEAPFYVDTYAAMDYVTDAFVPTPAAEGLAMTLAKSLSGASTAIYYRRVGPSPFYGNDLDYFYGDDAADFYSGPSAWALWPGRIDAVNDAYQLRVTAAAGGTQGRLTALAARIDVPDKSMRLNDVAIAPGGTRLAAAIGQMAVITHVQVTLQDSTADKVWVADKSATLGPLIRATAGGVDVAATIDVTIQGHD